MYETRRRIYVTQEEGSSLAVIDMDRDAILKEMPTGGEPEGVLTSGGWQNRLPSSEAGDLVQEVDISSGAITRDVMVGLRQTARICG
jgi:DNA-binding beta-propeller fold protein YncE